MAEYDYEEGGFMALYFVLTFLIIILIPLTFSYLVPSFKKQSLNRCQCSECTKKHHKENSTSSAIGKLPTAALVTLALWGVFFAIVYKLATTHIDSKIYDPFEILGLAPTNDEKAIKRHYKKLSIKFHPDKVKLAINQTIEEVSNHFVDLTKAYKALTDETVRENLRLYGNPDGKQDFKVGIALPPWVIESSNNIWVLGGYAILFGLGLPYLVGKWWFGSRSFTKDGVKGRTAELYFKGLTEDDTILDITALCAKGWTHEADKSKAAAEAASALREQVLGKIGGPDAWRMITRNASEEYQRGFILLFAHLLRMEVSDAKLRQEQATFIAKIPQLLTSLLSMSLSHNWLVPTLHIMHLHAYITQALLPGADELIQYPNVGAELAMHIRGKDRAGKLVEQIERNEKLPKEILSDVKEASKHLGKLQILDVHFKVIGERIITPGAIVQLVFRARVVPPTAESSANPATASPASKERQQAFLTSQKEAEVLSSSTGESSTASPFAHAPRVSGDKKPSWWIFVGDMKGNKVFVPPTKFSEVPMFDPSTSSSSGEPMDRLYKMTFQAPQQAGSTPLVVHFVSDSFVGDDVRRGLVLKVEDLEALTAEERGAEDDISDPEEDSLAGQMAALRGGSVKRPAGGHEDESDGDESTTDGESDSGSDSDSDSDSD